LEPSRNQRKDNLRYSRSSITGELQIDQSVAHNGICLTVVAIKTTPTPLLLSMKRSKTNLGNWKIGDHVNLERAMKLGDRLDGHMVQGHVDQVGNCIEATETNGSWSYTF
jgi:riboflavin synthase